VYASFLLAQPAPLQQVRIRGRFLEERSLAGAKVHVFADRKPSSAPSRSSRGAARMDGALAGGLSRATRGEPPPAGRGLRLPRQGAAALRVVFALESLGLE
jgi:hypothetical protein